MTLIEKPMHCMCFALSKLRFSDMHRFMRRKSTFEKHRQLRAIRVALDKNQKEFAGMLDISYPYLLAVEIGQRKLSESLARRITWRFGISSNIRDKEAAPMAWDQNSKKLVPYSLEMFRQHTSQLPT